MPVLRLDVAGIGDAAGDGGRYRDEGLLYDLSLVTQVRAALDALQADGVADRFVCGGLCSGAFWSLYAALQDERVRSVVLLNPRALIWDSRLPAARESRKTKRLVGWREWRRLARGEFNRRQVWVFLSAVSVHSASFPARALRRIRDARRARRAGGDATDLLLDELRDRGVSVHFVFTGAEPLYEELQAAGHLDRLDRWPNVHVEVLGTAYDTHTLRPPWLQRAVHALVDAMVEEELPRPARM